MRYIILALLLMGCTEYDATTKANQEKVERKSYEYRKEVIAKDMQYFMDPRTDLCFAAYYPGSHWGLLTEVPCSDKVKGYIK